MPEPLSNLKKIQCYLKSIEDGNFAYIVELFAPNAVMEQLPNRIYPNGIRSGVSGMAEAFEKGRKLFSSQTYEIKSYVVDGDRVAIEVLWTGAFGRPFRQPGGWSRDASLFRHVLRVQG